uniref:Uncharacterized protein n=1 Tax=Lotus japonicus TaxID=34305 RepID=I3S298_LOTJA|nr:unknown [Lotus japonicus]
MVHNRFDTWVFKKYYSRCRFHPKSSPPIGRFLFPPKNECT